jgi:uncharacterized protein YdhG (YjbR/CyaY superfamily)
VKDNQAAPESIDQYIAGFPLPVQQILERIRATVKAAAPGATEAIKYGMPTFILAGNLVHFAAWKEHIGFYSISDGKGTLTDELTVYAGSKGSLKFPLDKPIPYALISRIVAFRIEENLAKAGTRSASKYRSRLPKV